jgi:ergothioneine biosynthesis protein EgtB
MNWYSTRVVSIKGGALLRRFRRIRAFSESLIEGLSDADVCAQSMMDTSPAKWHIAHTTWFFENFVLRPIYPGYWEFDARFSLLFGDETVRDQITRSAKGLLTRPTLAAVLEYRAYVQAAIVRVAAAASPEAEKLIELGCHYEERHQELLVADLLHLFSRNPLEPAVWSLRPARPTMTVPALRWIEGRQGAVEIGAKGAAFAFEVEGPRHIQWLEYHRFASRLTTNGEWLGFMDAGGYGDARLWQPDGWAWVQANKIEAPLYWLRDEAGDWSRQFGLAGVAELDKESPVRNVSYYEADAFARWSGGRLPSEAEWESAAEQLDPSEGNFIERVGAVEPMPAPDRGGLSQMFGDLWEWTNSPAMAYPRFRAVSGSLGNFNERFGSGRYVLKGGSCATPRGHLRASYRHSLYPHQRWQFTGVRLARDD